MPGTCDLSECTSQLEFIDIRILLQILHDVPVSVPGKYQAKVGDCSRYPVKRENVVVFELFHQHHFLAKPLPRLSKCNHPALPHGPLILLVLCT